MAEARSAVATPRVQKKDLGTTDSFDDLVKSYRQMIVRNYFRFRNSIRNGVWPTSTNNLGVACGVSLYLLEYEPQYAQPVTAHLKRAIISLPLPAIITSLTLLPTSPLPLPQLIYTSKTHQVTI
ncbi:hypothetical protein Pcinc_022266 [Petrolisthes cinctipes]|uniref:Uncharacterized protein n=1 Tax=Petrolisthes cinctipes TaxID=88211 RepID=A0AAE1FDZ9_PETCI|nr:hypothetical protein Pcinc_022266 [Petrolisthes cinctipes]